MNQKPYSSPNLFTIRAEELAISNQALVEIMKAVFAKGIPFRFKALGWSMSPFIRNGDVITVTPLQINPPKVGEVVAFIRPDERKLVVHRVVARNATALYIQGDSLPNCPDGMVPFENILGQVTRIEREGHPIWLGLGIERYLIAWFSRMRLLTPLRERLAMVKKRFSRRYG